MYYTRGFHGVYYVVLPAYQDAVVYDVFVVYLGTFDVNHETIFVVLKFLMSTFKIVALSLRSVIFSSFFSIWYRSCCIRMTE